MAALLESSANRVTVGDRAQVVDAIELGAGKLQPPRARAHGKQQRVVVEFGLTAVEPHTLGVRIDLRRCCAQPQLDLAVTVERLVMDAHRVAFGLAAQVVLAQWRAFVRQLLLGADQHHPAIKAALTEFRGGLGAGKAGAHDHKCL